MHGEKNIMQIGEVGIGRQADLGKGGGSGFSAYLLCSETVDFRAVNVSLKGRGPWNRPSLAAHCKTSNCTQQCAPYGLDARSSSRNMLPMQSG